MPCLRIVLNIHERGHWGVKLILHCWVNSWFCKIKLYFICLYQLKFWESYLNFLKTFNFILYQGLACLGRKNIYDFFIYIKKASWFYLISFLSIYSDLKFSILGLQVNPSWLEFLFFFNSMLSQFHHLILKCFTNKHHCCCFFFLLLLGYLIRMFQTTRFGRLARFAGAFCHFFKINFLSISSLCIIFVWNWNSLFFYIYFLLVS
jgi:hypothetical protein